ncbi:hypothetical protein MKW94_030599 [Papaver nudicaule]|uniref:Response regulatory domain-containing protein n=1 Tax=Papaver nudicaule TaxID=74823 RepID=A0AA42B5W0_PAPNU|nr:hypothetical protein [Papaver nudicaule]
MGDHKKSHYFNALVVDDDPINRKVFVKFFTKMSATSSTPSSSSPALVFKVTTVESGSKALDKLLRGNLPFQMVITDYEMPGMTVLQPSDVEFIDKQTWQPPHPQHTTSTRLTSQHRQ